MNPGAELRRQRRIYRPVTFDAALALEGGRDHPHLEVRLAGRAGPARTLGGMGVARVLMRFVDDFEKDRREAGLQFRPDRRGDPGWTDRSLLLIAHSGLSRQFLRPSTAPHVRIACRNALRQIAKVSLIYRL